MCGIHMFCPVESSAVEGPPLLFVVITAIFPADQDPDSDPHSLVQILFLAKSFACLIRGTLILNARLHRQRGSRLRFDEWLAFPKAVEPTPPELKPTAQARS